MNFEQGGFTGSMIRMGQAFIAHGEQHIQKGVYR